MAARALSAGRQLAACRLPGRCLAPLVGRSGRPCRLGRAACRGSGRCALSASGRRRPGACPPPDGPSE
eukprot:4988249-Alexandrium_andersonii.AAC.1